MTGTASDLAITAAILAATALVCGAALAMGDDRMRRGALAALLANGLGALAAFAAPRLADAVAVPIDLVAIWVFIRLTWRAESAWPVLASAAQGLGLCVALEGLAFSPPASLAALVARLLLLSALIYGVVQRRRERPISRTTPGMVRRRFPRSGLRQGRGRSWRRSPYRG